MSNKNVIIDRIFRLKNIENLHDWSENLGSFFESYRNHPNLTLAFEAIHNKKRSAVKSFFQVYQAFMDGLSQLLQGLQKALRSFENLPPFPWQLVNEIASSKQLADPFFKPESQFFESCKTLRHFFEKLIENLFQTNQQLPSNALSLLTGYLDISTRIVYKQSISEKSLKAPMQGKR